MNSGRRAIGLTLMVAVLHILVISWALSLRTGSQSVSGPSAISIEFAEMIIVPDPPELPDDPSASAIETGPVDPAPEASIDAAATDPAPAILSQPSNSAAAEVEPVRRSRGDEKADAPVLVAPETLASVLQNMSCQRLLSERDPDCPKLDPFTVAEASIARQEAPLPAPNLVGDFGPKSAVEAFLSQKDREPFLMPGMSADLFTEGMGSAAYNAQRIRNGLSPIWDRDLERAFERQD